jgi:hypothetical protein
MFKVYSRKIAYPEGSESLGLRSYPKPKKESLIVGKRMVAYPTCAE